MCGRYGYTNTNKEKIKKAFRLKNVALELAPHYNIAPGGDVPVILNEHPDDLTLARWGLVPFWSKQEKTSYAMNNARSESVFEKPSFRHAIKRNRCLIPADFFYEWQKTGAGKKQAFCIRLKSQETFAFAGIWDVWEKGARPLTSCAIVTCGPNALMEKIHDRMPVILTDETARQWLGQIDEKAIKALMMPYPARQMEAFAVSTNVNSPTNDSPDLIVPLA